MTLVLAVAGAMMASCASFFEPNPLLGRWAMSSPLAPGLVLGVYEFRRSSMTVFGVTQDVEYSVEGNTVLVVPEGIGLAKNMGARDTVGRLLVFVDADSRLSPGLLETIWRRADAGERIASIRVIADGRDPLDHAFFWVLENGKRLLRIRANMLWCERRLFEELGGFDETLRQAEDLDLLVRARHHGVPVGHVHDEWIATSARRLHRLPLRLGMFIMLGRWLLGQLGIGRRWPYRGGGP